MSKEQVKLLQKIFQSKDREDYVIMIDKWVGSSSKDVEMFRIFQNCIRQIIIHFKQDLKDQRVRIALVQFDSSFPSVLTNFTSDIEVLLKAANSLAFSSGHNVVGGFQLAKNLFQKDSKETTKKKLILISDGYEVAHGAKEVSTLLSQGVEVSGIWISEKYGSLLDWNKINNTMVQFNDIYEAETCFRKLSSIPKEHPTLDIVKRNISSIEVSIGCSVDTVYQYNLFMLGTDDKIKLCSSSKKNVIVVKDLKPNTEYLFWGQVEVEGGIYPESSSFIQKNSVSGKTLNITNDYKLCSNLTEVERVVKDMIKKILKKEVDNEFKELCNCFNLLVIGRIGTGKSSFLNTLSSIFKKEYTREFSSDESQLSHTKEIQKYCLTKFINIFDMWGFEKDDENYQKFLLDLEFILKGSLKNGYVKDQSYDRFDSNPSPKDRIHCVIFVIDYSSIRQPSLLDLFKKIKSKVADQKINPLIVVTKSDLWDENIRENTSEIYNSGHITDQIQHFCKETGIDKDNVFPVVNYVSRYRQSDYVLEYSVLNALLSALSFSRTKFSNMLSKETKVETPIVKSENVESKNMKLLSTEELSEFFLRLGGNPDYLTISKIILDQNINGEVFLSMTEKEIEEVFNTIKFGTKKQLKAFLK